MVRNVRRKRRDGSKNSKSFNRLHWKSYAGWFYMGFMGIGVEEGNNTIVNISVVKKSRWAFLLKGFLSFIA